MSCLHCWMTLLKNPTSQSARSELFSSSKTSEYLLITLSFSSLNNFSPFCILNNYSLATALTYFSKSCLPCDILGWSGTKTSVYGLLIRASVIARIVNRLAAKWNWSLASSSVVVATSLSIDYWKQEINKCFSEVGRSRSTLKNRIKEMSSLKCRSKVHSLKRR